MVFSYDTRGILKENLVSYSCRISDEYQVRLLVSSETILDIEELDYAVGAPFAFLLGGYSRDLKQIFITHVVEASDAESLLTSTFYRTQGIIDYIGDVDYSSSEGSEKYHQALKLLSSKAKDETVNVNNPVLATKNTDGTVSFHLYFAEKLHLFIRE